MEESATQPAGAVTAQAEPPDPEERAHTSHDAPEAPKTAASAPGRAWVVVVSLFALLAITLGSLTAYNIHRIARTEAVQAREETILRVARQGVLNVTTLSHESIDADIKRLIDSSTGEYRRQFEGRSSTFRDMVAESAVASEGTITEAGIESSEETSGKALVAVRAEVSNKAAPEGEQRQYRMAVNVVREGDRWLVSGLEFVL